MGFDYGFTSRYRTFEDWTPAGMKLFKNGFPFFMWAYNFDRLHLFI